MHKIIVCIADGAADAPWLCPNGVTPLEKAQTPVLDTMTRHSVAGLYYPIPEGFSPDSDVGNMSLFGYSPTQFHNGRAPIEAAALGIAASNDDLIWRVTFCTTEKNVITTPCASSISQKEGTELIHTLNAQLGNTEFSFFPNKTYRHLLLQRGGKQAKPVNTCGPHMLYQTDITDSMTSYSAELQIMMREAGKILSAHTSKANAVWLWGQGSPYTLPAFSDLTKTNACIISGVPLLHGLGTMANMSVIRSNKFTGLPDTNLHAKAAAALSFLQHDKNDVAFIHVEAPDHYGHLGDADGKRSAIERIDSELLPALLDAMPDALIAVTADHLTPAATKSHAHGAVPFIAYHNSFPEQDKVTRFTESECKKGVHLSQDTLLLPYLISL